MDVFNEKRCKKLKTLYEWCSKRKNKGKEEDKMTSTSTDIQPLLDMVLSVINESKEEFRFKLPASVAEVTFKVSTFRGTVEYVAEDVAGNTVPDAISKKVIEIMEALLKKKLARYRGNKRSTHALLWTKENMVTYLHYIEDDLLPL